jgi:hypothetical protein
MFESDFSSVRAQKRLAKSSGKIVSLSTSTQKHLRACLLISVLYFRLHSARNRSMHDHSPSTTSLLSEFLLNKIQMTEI